MLTADRPIDDERLDETFAALANSTRRALLARLVEGEATVNQLAAPFAMTLPAISKHIKVLERAGLIERSRNAQFRPCRLDPGPLAEVASWTELYRPIWEARFDRLSDYLRHVQPNDAQSNDAQSNDSQPNDTQPNDTQPNDTQPTSESTDQ